VSLDKEERKKKVDKEEERKIVYLFKLKLILLELRSNLII